MNDSRNPIPVSIRIPKDFFAMTEREQEKWVFDYFKNAFGERFASAPDENEKDQSGE